MTHKPVKIGVALSLGTVLLLSTACSKSSKSSDSSSPVSTSTGTSVNPAGSNTGQGNAVGQPCQATGVQSAASGTDSGLGSGTLASASTDLGASSSTDLSQGASTDATAGSGLALADAYAAAQPIIAAKCATAGCHGSGSSNGDYTKNAVVKAQAAKIATSLQSGAPFPMPPGGVVLPAAELTTILAWASAGGAASGTGSVASTSGANCPPAVSAGSGASTDGTTGGAAGGGTGSITGNGTGGGSGGWNPGPGLEACTAQKLAWVAVNNGGPGTCGDPLAAFCCTQAEVFRQFPSVQAALQTKIDPILAAGLKLYDCSTSASGTTTLHYALQDASGVHYQTVSFSGATASGGQSAGQCPTVSSTDLGISAAATGGSGTAVGGSTGGTTAGGTTGGTAAGGTTGGGTTGGIPASIGTDSTLANTTPTNLLLELSAERSSNSGYRSWSSKPGLVPITNLIPGAATWTKPFWNPTLVTSIQANAANHPVGSISVLEAYGDSAGTQFKGWLVLGKATTGTDAGSWFTYEMTGTPNAGGLPSFPSSPQVNGLGDASCSGCHVTPAYPTYIIGSPF